MQNRTVFLNRKLRRELARRSGLPWGQLAQHNGPVVRVLKNLFYWKGLGALGEPITYHIFTHCRRLFAEWAGRDGLREGRANHPKAGVVCPECSAGFREGRTY